MSHVYGIAEYVGSSTLSSDDAVRNAIATAGLRHEHIGWYEVVSHRGHVEKGEIIHFQITLRVGFRMDESDE